MKILLSNDDGYFASGLSRFRNQQMMAVNQQWLKG